MLQNTFF